MHQPNCEICGQPATVYDTTIKNGKQVASRCLCQQHGTGDLKAILQRQAASPQDALAQLNEWHAGLTVAEKNRLEMEYRLSRRRH